MLAGEQKRRSPAIILVGLLVTGYLVYSNMELGILSILSHLVLSFIAIRFMAFISVVTLQRKYYNGDIQSFISEVVQYESRERGEISAEAPTSKAVVVTIVDYPDAPCATYKDQPIFDWLVVEIEGQQFKVAYQGIRNVVEGQELNLNKDEILIAPGILYAKVL